MSGICFAGWLLFAWAVVHIIELYRRIDNLCRAYDAIAATKGERDGE